MNVIERGAEKQLPYYWATAEGIAIWIKVVIEELDRHPSIGQLQEEVLTASSWQLGREIGGLNRLRESREMTSLPALLSEH